MCSVEVDEVIKASTSLDSFVDDLCKGIWTA
jgi:hypothetical protein